MLSLDPNCPQPKVIVVGAGIAGLSAAHRLIKGGLRNVIVLEALDRPGGRIHSVSVGNGIAEMGAGWIIGASMANPVFCLACQAGIVDEPLIRRPSHRGFCFLPNGRYIPSRICRTAALIFEEIVQMARGWTGKVPSTVSLWNFFDKKLKIQAKTFPKYDQDRAKNVLYGLTNNIRSSLGADLINIPLNRFGYWKTMPGGEIAPKGGFKRVLEPLLNEIPQGSIRYSKPVRSISWRPKFPGGSRVIIETCDGEEFNGDYVIMTVSLGVLKEQHENLFYPKLPQNKIEAIEKLKFGYINNICLQYEKPFWILNEGCLLSCWSKDDLEDLQDWTKCIGKIEDVRNSKDILITTIAGQSAKCIEYLTECELSIEMTKILRKFLGDPTVPQPKYVFRSQWSTNCFFRGSASYLNRESVERDQDILAQPIPDQSEEKAPMVFFAGEACYPGYQGTVHGARLSGLQEAERILNLTKCFCGPPPILKVECY